MKFKKTVEDGEAQEQSEVATNGTDERVQVDLLDLLVMTDMAGQGINPKNFATIAAPERLLTWKFIHDHTIIDIHTWSWRD